MFAQGRPRPLPPLEQASFGLGQLVGRPDGSLLAAGGVRVVRYRGEGTGSSTGLFAAAALTRGLAPLADFGGPPSAPLLGVRIADQTPAVSSRLKRVVVRVSASSPGLSLVRVRARGRVIAQSLEPVYEAATSTAKVRLTRTGERLLRRRRAIAITVTATLRDVLTQRTTATTRGVLRPDARRVRRAPRDAVEAAVRRAARHYAVRDRIAVGATLRSRRNDAWSLVTGSYGKRGLWAAWVRRRSGGAYRVEVFRTRRFDPGRRPPCDIRPAFSEPDC